MEEELNKLKEELSVLEEQISNVMDSDQEETARLIQEYKKIKSVMNDKEAEIEEQQRLAEEQERIEMEKIWAEREAIKEEREEFLENLNDRIAEKISSIDQKVARKSEKLDKKIANLEYKKEIILQELYRIDVNLFMEQEKLVQAKETKNVPVMIESSDRVDELIENQRESDLDLDKINSKLDSIIIKKTAICNKHIKAIEGPILDYNKQADEYGFKKISLPEIARERSATSQIYGIMLEQQRKYRLEKYDEKSEYGILEDLTNEAREELEAESKARLKEIEKDYDVEDLIEIEEIEEIQEPKVPFQEKLKNAFKVAAEFIVRNAKKIWNKMKLGFNKLLSTDNNEMLTEAKSVEEQAQKNEITFEQKREDFTKQYETTLSEEQFREAQEKANQTQREKFEQENEFDDSGNVI